MTRETASACCPLVLIVWFDCLEIPRRTRDSSGPVYGRWGCGVAELGLVQVVSDVGADDG